MSRKNKYTIITAIILFLILAIAIKADYLSGFESWVYNQTAEYISDTLTVILKAITHMGGPIGILCVCIIIYIIPKFRNVIAIPVAMSVTSSFILNIILKRIFARQRPDILRLISESYYSFPSGHAMVNMALYFIIMLYTHKLVKSKKIKYTVYVLLTLLVAAIGFTRIYLGVHYAGDIIGGWLMGIAVSATVYAVTKKYTLASFNEYENRQGEK